MPYKLTFGMYYVCVFLQIIYWWILNVAYLDVQPTKTLVSHPKLTCIQSFFTKVSQQQFVRLYLHIIKTIFFFTVPSAISTKTAIDRANRFVLSLDSILSHVYDFVTMSYHYLVSIIFKCSPFPNKIYYYYYLIYGCARFKYKSEPRT